MFHEHGANVTRFHSGVLTSFPVQSPEKTVEHAVIGGRGVLCRYTALEGSQRGRLGQQSREFSPWAQPLMKEHFMLLRTDTAEYLDCLYPDEDLACVCAVCVMLDKQRRLTLWTLSKKPALILFGLQSGNDLIFHRPEKRITGYFQGCMVVIPVFTSAQSGSETALPE